MDDRVKCMVYQYLFRKLHDEESALSTLSDRLRSRSFPVGPADYSEYAHILSRKQATEEIMAGVFTVLNIDYSE